MQRGSKGLEQTEMNYSNEILQTKNEGPAFGGSTNGSAPSAPMLDQKRLELLEQRVRGTSPIFFSPTHLSGVKEMDEDSPRLTREETSDSEDVSASNQSVSNSAVPSTPDEPTQQKKKRKHFTPKEDDKIIEGVKMYGSNWEEIAKWSQLDRTGSQIKERWKRMVQQKKIQPNLMDTEPIATPSKVRKVNEEQSNSVGTKETTKDVKVPAIVLSKSTLDSNPISEQGILQKIKELQFQEKKLEQERRQLEEDREKLLAKEKSIQEREQNLKITEQQLKQMVSKEEKVENTKIEQTRNVLTSFLQQNAQMSKEISRTKLAKESQRLGNIVFERHGTTFVEVWQDGDAFHELNKRRDRLNEEKENLEKMKKDLSKKRKKKIAEGALQTDVQDILLQEEVVRVRIATNKKDETDLDTEREKLLAEKNVHIRELKRVFDEDHSRFRNSMVLKNQYVLLHLLGKGGFSEVYKAYDIVELREVACKIHQLNTLWTEKKKENYIKHAVREYNIHKAMAHPKIVKLYDVFEIDENSFCTVLEHCNGKDLDLYLKVQQTLSEKESKAIMIQIFSGLKYLSEQKRPIIHFDLKPGNILFHDGEVKITDFGLSKVMEENQDQLELTSQGAGTYWYLPPECFDTGKEPPKISSKVDVWSAGVIFYQMLFGKKPFGNNVSQQKILAENIIQTSVLEFPAKPAISKEAKEFIQRMLVRSQKDRPDVPACAVDPYLKLQATQGKRSEKQEK